MFGGKFYKINHFISAEKVRVVDETGKQLGIMPTAKALENAKKRGLDLVEVAPQAQPPVCKIIDFKKFKYQEKKKRQAGGRRKKQPGLKKVKLNLFIDEHDLKRIIKKGKEFLKSGNKIKFIILFRGREITKKEFGFSLFEKIKEELQEMARVCQEPKIQGKILEMTLETKPRSKNAQD